MIEIGHRYNHATVYRSETASTAWDQFLALDEPEREWVLGVLRGCVRDGDDGMTCAWGIDD